MNFSHSCKHAVLKETRYAIGNAKSRRFSQRLIDLMIEELIEKGILRLPNFGSFVLRKEKAHINSVSDFKTGNREIKEIPERTKVTFKPSTYLKAKTFDKKPLIER